MSAGPRTGRSHAGSRRGFTLVELVVAVLLVGLVAAATADLFLRPMEAFGEATRRAALVDRASAALVRMEREVRAALPNSVRVAPGGRQLELLAALDGARYREGAGVNPSGQDHGAPADRFDFPVDASWNALGRFAHLGFTYGTSLPAGTRVAVHPAGSYVWAHAATGASPGIVTPASTTVTIVDDGDEDQVRLSAPHRFALRSPQRRFYLVGGPVTFHCDPGTGVLDRYAGYAPTAAQPTDPTAAPLAGAPGVARLADGVAACGFRYDPGSPTRSALVTLDLTLAEGGEQARLLEQVHVENVP